jgi:glycosyltransferase involved in cell wall biosynthesis
MKLLILTQAVDLDDPALGFMHRWIEVLAPRFEFIHVVCLQKGRQMLPANVAVHSLGKEEGRSRIKYLWRFYRHTFRLRREYDSVFVHMNSEYAVLGGIFWRMAGKRLVLWRNHVLNGWSTWLGAHIAHVVCYTSPSSYTARFKNSVKMPIGIDTREFAPAASPAPERSILFFGRLDEVKNPHVFIDALVRLRERGMSFHADLVGGPTYPDSEYARAVQHAASQVEGVRLMGSVAHANAPAVFASHSLYVNLTPSGSFDKTIGEALACECLVVCGNDAVRAVVPSELLVDPLVPESVANGLESALALGQDARASIARRGREYVEREHSLSLLAGRLSDILCKTT